MYSIFSLYLLSTLFLFLPSNQAGTEQVKYRVEKQTKERQDFNLEKEKKQQPYKQQLLTTTNPYIL